ncbi:MAG: phage tail tube protein [Pseudomonadota bacterium]
MTLGRGFEGIIGVKKEAVYGTVVQVDEALPFVSENYALEIEKHIDEVLRGKAGRGTTTAGNNKFSGTIPAKLTYEDLDLLIAIAMGAAGTPAVNGALYDNTYSLAENLGYSFVSAIYKGVSVWEFAGNKVNTMKISGEANKPLDIEFGVNAKSFDLSSVTNTPAVLTALDTEDAAPKIMFSDLEFKIAAQASALSGESEKGIGSFDLNLENNMAVDQFDNRALTILEPQRNGFREVTFSFKVPRYEADTYLDWRDADTALHCYLKFTNGNYRFDIHIPKLKIDKVDAAIGGPGLVEQNIECTCFRDPGSLSSSFTLEDEFEIEVTNGRSTSPLA